jgi:HD-GYP domain-containing protein (c-di-GMP phosphodiesterase class II)
MTATQFAAAHRPLADARLRELRDALDDAFGCDFHVLDIESGTQVHVAAESPRCDQLWQQELLAAVARQSQPQCIAEEDSLAVFAIPLTQVWNLPWVAVAPFVTRSLSNDGVARSARLLAIPEEKTRHWINQQPIWPAHALDRVGNSLLRRLRDQKRIGQLEREVEKVSSSLTSSYEEISLLHSISQNFRLSSTDEELGKLALEWLLDCIPVRGVSLLHLPVAKPNETTYRARTEPQLLSYGDCPLDTAESVLALVDAMHRESTLHNRGEGVRRPLVINRIRSHLAPLLPANVHHLIVAPLIEGERIFGYLLAFNHKNNNEELGTVEANLIASVSAMLGVHCSNRDLYRQQDELLASVVRALTSAIDAKDPYTHGHSARVARVATRLAKELGGDADFLATVYMAGLLHDIGKIGIDDAVLRKPGRLTDAEFEHIKQHPGLGHRILTDIKQFAIVLPAVMHHHEQWDGRGYPSQLAGDQIPYIARIIAVADAYDAMSSDRPYRPGMPEDKIRKIFSEGSAKQWDPQVVAAFFAVYNDIRNIVQQQPAASVDLPSWMT